mmetsp:Transcript_39582/g.92558  ORF Transcript_39582/g.92558 Transcript_39582/m.92558 type:complete len:510 (+) Transcript_39582:571-2100(+)
MRPPAADGDAAQTSLTGPQGPVHGPRNVRVFGIPSQLSVTVVAEGVHPPPLVQHRRVAPSAGDIDHPGPVGRAPPRPRALEALSPSSVSEGREVPFLRRNGGVAHPPCRRSDPDSRQLLRYGGNGHQPFPSLLPRTLSVGIVATGAEEAVLPHQQGVGVSQVDPLVAEGKGAEDGDGCDGAVDRVGGGAELSAGVPAPEEGAARRVEESAVAPSCVDAPDADPFVVADIVVVVTGILGHSQGRQRHCNFDEFVRVLVASFGPQQLSVLIGSGAVHHDDAVASVQERPDPIGNLDGRTVGRSRAVRFQEGFQLQKIFLVGTRGTHGPGYDGGGEIQIPHAPTPEGRVVRGPPIKQRLNHRPVRIPHHVHDVPRVSPLLPKVQLRETRLRQIVRHGVQHPLRQRGLSLPPRRRVLRLRQHRAHDPGGGGDPPVVGRTLGPGAAVSAGAPAGGGGDLGTSQDAVGTPAEGAVAEDAEGAGERVGRVRRDGAADVNLTDGVPDGVRRGGHREG